MTPAVDTEKPRKPWQRFNNLKGGKPYRRSRLLASRLADVENSKSTKEGPRAQLMRGVSRKRAAEPSQDITGLISEKRRMLSHIQIFSREQVKLQMEHILYGSKCMATQKYFDSSTGPAAPTC